MIFLVLFAHATLIDRCFQQQSRVSQFPSTSTLALPHCYFRSRIRAPMFSTSSLPRKYSRSFKSLSQVRSFNARHEESYSFLSECIVQLKDYQQFTWAPKCDSVEFDFSGSSMETVEALALKVFRPAVCEEMKIHALLSYLNHLVGIHMLRLQRANPKVAVPFFPIQVSRGDVCTSVMIGAIA